MVAGADAKGAGMTEESRETEVLPAETEETVSELLAETRDFREFVLAAESRTRAAVQIVEVLRQETIGRSSAVDWVRLGEYAYLWKPGYERVCKAWGIRFQPLDLRRDVLKEYYTGTDGVRHVRFLVQRSALCLRTGEEYSDLGTASSSGGFYRDRWLEGDVETQMALELDIQKHAITNATGRVIRFLTGTSGLPITALKALGIPTDRIRSVEYARRKQKAAEAAPDSSEEPTPPRKPYPPRSPGDATEAQRELLLRLIVEQAGLGRGAAEALLGQAPRLSQGAALAAIEELRQSSAKVAPDRLRELLGLRSRP
jgi:hypothetical protein